VRAEQGGTRKPVDGNGFLGNLGGASRAGWGCHGNFDPPDAGPNQIEKQLSGFTATARICWKLPKRPDYEGVCGKYRVLARGLPEHGCANRLRPFYLICGGRSNRRDSAGGKSLFFFFLLAMDTPERAVAGNGRKIDVAAATRTSTRNLPRAETSRGFAARYEGLRNSAQFDARC